MADGATGDGVECAMVAERRSVNRVQEPPQGRLLAGFWDNGTPTAMNCDAPYGRPTDEYRIIGT